MAGAQATSPPSSVSDWQTYPALTLPTILAAALAEFQTRGYHGTTVRSIATRSQLAMPSLYYHYGNKEGILFALLEIAMDDLEAHVTASLEAGATTRLKFENFVSSVALHYTHRRQLAMLHDESRFLGPESRAKYLSRRTRVQVSLEDLLRTGAAEGLFVDNDPPFTARAILGMVSGILDWYREDGPLSAGDIANRYRADALRLALQVPGGLT
jgi:TetR/AcrR family transcriptional regulator, cholesterol catabolism regulator